MTDLHSDVSPASRSAQLTRAISDLLSQAPELEAAAVVSFDGLPMAAALPASMDEDRVAAMSAALLSLGERAAQGLGRGELSQVYIEGDNGTVFLVSADDEAVLVAVASKGSKAGMMLYEVRRAAAVVAAVLRAELPGEAPPPAGVAVVPDVALAPEPTAAIPTQPSAPTWSPADRTVPHLAYEAPAPGPVEPYHTAPVHAVPTYDLPAHAAPVREAAYDLPAGAAPVSTPPVHEAPGYPAPIHEAAVHEAPGYQALGYELPVYLAQQYVEPAPVHPTASAPEPVWPTYAPTGSVMPGGGVPPSTWS